MGWWVVYYEDGSRFTDQQGSPWNAPRLGVQLIAQQDDRVGYRYISGCDFYTYELNRGGWHTTEQWGLYDHLMRAYIPCVLFGRNMSDEAFAALHARCKAELGDKQGWLTQERRRDD